MSFSELSLASDILNHLRGLGYDNVNQLLRDAFSGLQAQKHVLLITPTGAGEVEACALQVFSQLASQSNARILVLSQDEADAGRFAQDLQEFSPKPIACHILRAGAPLPAQGVLLALPGWQLPDWGSAEASPALVILPSLHQLALERLQELFHSLPAPRQVLAVSSNTGAQSQALQSVLPDLQLIQRRENSAGDVAQVNWPVPASLKLRLALHLLERAEYRNVVVYVANLPFALRLARKLRARRIPAFSIQRDRNDDRTLSDQRDFLNGKAGVLITADLPLEKFTHSALQVVLHYDFPTSEAYLQRLQAVAPHVQVVNLLSPDEEEELLAVEAALGRPLRRLESATFDYHAVGENETIDTAEPVRDERPTARRESRRDEASAPEKSRPEAGNRRNAERPDPEEDDWSPRTRPGKPFEWDPEVPRTWGTRHPDPAKTPLENWQPDPLPDYYNKGQTFKPGKPSPIVRLPYGSIGRYRSRPRGESEPQPLGPAVGQNNRTEKGQPPARNGNSGNPGQKNEPSRSLSRGEQARREMRQLAQSGNSAQTGNNAPAADARPNALRDSGQARGNRPAGNNAPRPGNSAPSQARSGNAPETRTAETPKNAGQPANRTPENRIRAERQSERRNARGKDNPANRRGAGRPADAGASNRPEKVVTDKAVTEKAIPGKREDGQKPETRRDQRAGRPNRPNNQRSGNRRGKGQTGDRGQDSDKRQDSDRSAQGSDKGLAAEKRAKPENTAGEG